MSYEDTKSCGGSRYTTTFKKDNKKPTKNPQNKPRIYKNKAKSKRL